MKIYLYEGLIILAQLEVKSANSQFCKQSKITIKWDFCIKKTFIKQFIIGILKGVFSEYLVMFFFSLNR